jgi:hypothetical protein
MKGAHNNVEYLQQGQVYWAAVSAWGLQCSSS